MMRRGYTVCSTVCSSGYAATDTYDAHVLLYAWTMSVSWSASFLLGGLFSQAWKAGSAVLWAELGQQ
jgi:hypothetical protein